MKHTVISFLIYCFISGITPGPANLLSLATALTCGKQAALRQWRGLFTGYCIVSLTSALLVYFVGQTLEGYLTWFRWIGAGYILWLAVQLLRSALTGDSGSAADSPVKHGFWTGLLTQLTNVKIMIFCITALTGFVLPYTNSLGALLLAGAFLPLTGPVCNLVWLFAGASMQSVFSRYRKPVGAAMALALVGCAIEILR